MLTGWARRGAAAQAWLDKHFPTREMFSPMAAFVLRIAPEYEEQVRQFKQRHFGVFTIGMQVPEQAAAELSALSRVWASLPCLLHGLCTAGKACQSADLQAAVSDVHDGRHRADRAAV